MYFLTNSWGLILFLRGKMIQSLLVSCYIKSKNYQIIYALTKVINKYNCVLSFKIMISGFLFFFKEMVSGF